MSRKNKKPSPNSPFARDLRSNQEFYKSAFTDRDYYNYYYEKLKGIATSIFEWKNLPQGVDERYIEKTLFESGACVFFKDDMLKGESHEGYLALKTAQGGNLDLYGNLIVNAAVSSNGAYFDGLNDENSVVIYNNWVRTNGVQECRIYAKQLAQIQLTINTNLNALRTPILISCDENQTLTMKNLYMKYEGNQPVIIGDKNLKPDALKVLNTQAPNYTMDLYKLKTQVWNEALSHLGVSNFNVDKKERLLTGEIQLQQGSVISERYGRLNARKEACKKINEMFGLDIECNYREDYQFVYGSQDQQNGEGFVNSEDVLTNE